MTKIRLALASMLALAGCSPGAGDGTGGAGSGGPGGSQGPGVAGAGGPGQAGSVGTGGGAAGRPAWPAAARAPTGVAGAGSGVAGTTGVAGASGVAGAAGSGVGWWQHRRHLQMTGCPAGGAAGTTPPACTSNPADYQFPFQDPCRPIEDRITNLLSQLTAAEKLTLMNEYQPSVTRLNVPGSRRSPRGCTASAGRAPAPPTACFT